MTTFIASPGEPEIWSNMPLAATEMISGRTRVKVDLSGLTEFRFQANQTAAGRPTAKLWVEYSLDQSAWSRLEAVGATTELAASGTGLLVSPYAALAADAQADVYVRLAGSGGNGAVDPAWSLIILQAR